LFGGIVTVLTGLIAKAYGPSIGGLFLAFPAILPATFTLLKEHDGREKAAQAAAGAVLGALGLVPFAVVALWMSSRHPPAIALALATVSWVGTSLFLWLVVYGRLARRKKPMRPALLVVERRIRRVRDDRQRNIRLVVSR
jgi:hypothetical protein